MKIVILDAATLGNDISMNAISNVGDTQIYDLTEPAEVALRLADAEVAVVNKIKLNKDNLTFCKRLKLICLAATGYDNVDTEYCQKAGITVSNVRGYSTESVTQTTVASILELTTQIRAYTEFVADGSYSRSKMANRLYPVYHELCGKTWGIVGAGSIGGRVVEVAKALGCRVIVNKRTADPKYECVDIDSLCAQSHIISIHTPLTAETRGLIGQKQLSLMKKEVILYNAARGAVLDEQAVATAVLDGRIAAFGTDVYSTEPFGESHPIYRLKELPNVCLTPHMAWGSYEARVRCVKEIAENIKSFENGRPRNAVV